MPDVSINSRVIVRSCHKVEGCPAYIQTDRINPPTFKGMVYQGQPNCTLYRNNLAGSNQGNLASTSGSPSGNIGYLVADDEIWCGIGTSPSLREVPANGGTFVSPGSTGTNLVTRGYIKQTERIIYFTEDRTNSSNPARVKTYDIDAGGTATQIGASSGNNFFAEMAFDPTRDDIYALYFHLFGGSYIERMQTDGGGNVTIYSSDFIDGIAIDPWNGFLYFIQGTSLGSAGDLLRLDLSDFSTTVISANAVTTMNQSISIDIDVARQHLYWSSTAGQNIQRCDFDGANLTTLVSGVGNLRGVKLTEKEYT